MKKLVAICILLCVVFQSTSRLWVLASFYLQRNYIAENICVNRFDTIPVCQGQCYLNKQLKENEKQEQKFPDLKQKEIVLFFEDAPLFQSLYTFDAPKNLIPLRGEQFIVDEWLFAIFHPPQTA